MINTEYKYKEIMMCSNEVAICCSHYQNVPVAAAVTFPFLFV